MCFPSICVFSEYISSVVAMFANYFWVYVCGCQVCINSKGLVYSVILLLASVILTVSISGPSLFTYHHQKDQI